MEKDVSEVIGKTDFDLFPEGVAKIPSSERSRLYWKAELQIEVDQRYYPDKDSNRFIHMVKSPIFNSRKQVVGVLGIFWEITKKVEAEKRLSELNKNLEALVKERTKEIEVVNKELTISEKRYRAIIESQVEYVFRWDLTRRHYLFKQ